MAPEPVNQWSGDDVATWLCAIGLGSKVEPFKENAVDGALLASLSKEDLQNDLGLSGIQAKKILLELEFINGLTSGGEGGADPAELEKLQAELEEKDAKIAQLEKELAALKPAPPPEPAPAPAPSTTTTKTTTQHSAPRNEHHVLKGAAGGAAKGAVTGAVVGAIAGDPAAGAKAGAAGGATLGAMNGVGRRRRARRGGRFG